MPPGADLLTSVGSGNIWVELGTLKLCVCVFWTGLNRFLLQRRQGVCSDVCALVHPKAVQVSARYFK